MTAETNLVDIKWINTMESLLFHFEEIEFKDITDPTFLELINQSRKENVWSRFLLFFFDPNKEHDLKDLFLKSWFELLGVDFVLKNPKSFKGKLEKSTEERKRIDIVIQTAEFVIGIENKVDHGCDNPFPVYSEMLKKLAGKKKLHKAILSIKHCSQVSGFKNVRYEQFVSKIEANLPEYINGANPRYLMILMDFLRNIKNVQKSLHMLENESAIDFFKNHYQSVAKLSDKFLEFKSLLHSKFYEIHSLIDEKRIEYNVREKIDTDLKIFKDDIYDDNGKQLPEFYIYVEFSSVNVHFCTYVLDNMTVFTYMGTEDDNLKTIVPADECDSVIFKDAKIAANEIVKLVEESLVQFYLNLLKLFPEKLN